MHQSLHPPKRARFRSLRKSFSRFLDGEHPPQEGLDSSRDVVKAAAAPSPGAGAPPAVPAEAQQAQPDRPAPGGSKGSPWIVNRWVDQVAIIFSPLLALLLGALIWRVPWAQTTVEVGGYSNELSDLFIGTFIFSHLFIVFFRSHGNKAIFQQHKVRFLVAPVVLFTAMMISTPIAIGVAMVTVIWDVYHSCMQTFGIGRIYDAKAGNDMQMGRRLDQGINLLLYAGPILGGRALIMHVHQVVGYTEDTPASLFFSELPMLAIKHQAELMGVVLAVAVPFLVYYVWSYHQFSRNGYQVSWEKVCLFVSTAICSIFAWGYNSFGEAFFIMNFFHALQYFVLVWRAERKNMQGILHLKGRKWGRPLTFAAFLVSAAAFGFWAEITPGSNDVGFAIIIVVAVMHFWYDGFIWSVRKKEI